MTSWRKAQALIENKRPKELFYKPPVPNNALAFNNKASTKSMTGTGQPNHIDLGIVQGSLAVLGSLQPLANLPYIPSDWILGVFTKKKKHLRAAFHFTEDQGCHPQWERWEVSVCILTGCGSSAAQHLLFPEEQYPLTAPLNHGLDIGSVIILQGHFTHNQEVNSYIQTLVMRTSGLSYTLQTLTWRLSESQSQMIPFKMGWLAGWLL